MKDTEIKITKVCLQVAGQKIELTLEQAKELKRILNDAFPDETPVVYRDIHHYRWWEQPSYVTTPCAPYTSGTPLPTPGTVTCGIGGSTNGDTGQILTLCAKS